MKSNLRDFPTLLWKRHEAQYKQHGRLSHSSQASAELGPKNPTPDLTYGFQRSEFSSDELRLLSQSGLEVAKDIVSPFFVMEWKAWRGNLLDAKVQARRAGAAMVWGRRKARDAMQVAGAVLGMDTGANAGVIEDLDSGLGSPMDLDATRTAEGEQPRTSPARVFSTTTQARDDEYPDSDLNAIAFSCVISPDIVFFYVHWAEDSQASPLNPVTHPASATALPNDKEVRGKKMYLETPPFFIRDEETIVRGSLVCHRGRESSPAPWKFVVKYKWMPPWHEPEAELLKKAWDRNVWGVAQFHSYGVIDKTENLRSGLIFGAPQQFKAAEQTAESKEMSAAKGGFQQQYNHKISQSSVSESLSTHFDSLDNIKDSNRARLRLRQ
jgi:hypothetical protein